MKPAAWLKDGDLVEIEIEKIGKIANKMAFEK
jgi:2-keto-4-pentenoate hydratase/2-oxohepta-3-ene-1,7-dioic acid hydratase in catechol pathway